MRATDRPGTSHDQRAQVTSPARPCCRQHERRKSRCRVGRTPARAGRPTGHMRSRWPVGLAPLCGVPTHPTGTSRMPPLKVHSRTRGVARSCVLTASQRNRGGRSGGVCRSMERAESHGGRNARTNGSGVGARVATRPQASARSEPDGIEDMGGMELREQERPAQGSSNGRGRCDSESRGPARISR